MPSRAARSPGSPTVTGRCRATSRIAACAVTSLASKRLALVQDSTAWTSASIPVAAVSAAGSDTVRVASRIALAAPISGPQAQAFLPAALVKTTVLVVSDPVPAVVGAQITGRRPVGSGWAQKA